MELSLNAGSVLETLPTALSVSGSVLFLIVGLWLRLRKTNLEGRKTESDVHLAQVESLMSQVRLLSEELNQTREQMNVLHHQNLELMGQLREANRRIGELEVLLNEYQRERETPGERESPMSNAFNSRSFCVG